MNDGDPIIVPVPGEAFAIGDAEAMRLSMVHSLLRAGYYDDYHEIRQDVIAWLVFAGHPEYIPTDWYRDTVFMTAHGLDVPAEVTERQAMYFDRIMQDRIRRGESPTSIQAELMDWLSARVKTARYTDMVSRTLDGSDPLVQEP